MLKFLKNVQALKFVHKFKNGHVFEQNQLFQRMLEFKKSDFQTFFLFPYFVRKFKKCSRFRNMFGNFKTVQYFNVLFALFRKYSDFSNIICLKKLFIISNKCSKIFRKIWKPPLQLILNCNVVHLYTREVNWLVIPVHMRLVRSSIPCAGGSLNIYAAPYQHRVNWRAC